MRLRIWAIGLADRLVHSRVTRADFTSAVQVTRLRMPLAPATPTNVVPSVSSGGISQRQPWCSDGQSPSSATFDAWAQAWLGGSDSSRESSSLAIGSS